MQTIIALAVALLLVALSSAQDKKPLTNADVVTMVQGGLDESTIILSIKSSASNFDTSALALIELKKNGVNQNILKAMLNATGAQTPAAVVPVANPGSSDAAALMAKVVAALGGEGPLAAIKATRFTANRPMKMPTGDTIVEAEETTIYPDRSHINLKWGQFNTVTNVSPEGSFILVNGKEQPFPSPQEFVKAAKLNIHYVGQHARDPRYSFVIKGQEQIGDHDTSILEISVDGDMARWNVDNASGRVVRITRTIVFKGTPVTTVSDLSDWRIVNGVSVPFRTVANGVFIEECKTFEINPEIPANLFDKPKAKK